MALAAGARLGPYEIVSPLGAGGMGEVWRARDTRLGREVAIKVLPEAFAADPVRLQRFEQEARAASALNHPNIVTVHDIGQAGGSPYIAMELVEGNSVRELMTTGPLPMRRLLGIAAQCAEGLAKAHGAGIVHRDLKPENVMVSTDGFVKILDFGLAKLVAESAEAASQVPTAARPETHPGTVMGTVGYMSPEQAAGQQLDFRSDQFSFGSILYEMATGKRAFQRPTSVDTLAAIMHEEPEPIGSLAPKSPAPLRWIVDRCLAKDPKERYASTVDLARDLASVRQHISELSGGEASLPSGGRRSNRGLKIWAPAAALIAGLVVGLLARGRRGEVSELKPAMRLNLTFSAAEAPIPYPDPLGPSLALSPDGTRLVYVGQASGGSLLYVRPLDQFAVMPLSGTAGAIGPFFSPDGRWVGFWADGKLKKMSLSGGQPLVLCDAPALRGAEWAADGTILFAPSSSGLLRVSDQGGEPKVVTTPDKSRGEITHRWPQILPGAKAALFTAHGPSGSYDNARIGVVLFETGERKTILEGATDARYLPTGHLVYLRGGSLYAVPFDVQRLAVAGPPVPVLDGLQTLSIIGSGNYAFSSNGSLVYVPTDPRLFERELVWLDRRGNARTLAEIRRFYSEVRLSPDGRFLATVAGLPDSDIWICDLARGSWERLTAGGLNSSIVWAPDGRSIAFASNRSGAINPFLVPIDRSRPPEQLFKSDSWTFPVSFSPDGRLLLIETQTPKTNLDISVLPLDGDRKPRPFIQTPASEGNARFSPDGRFVAYDSDASGRAEVYVAAYPGPAGRWQISTEGGQVPEWSRDGRELFYFAGDKAMAVTLQTRPNFVPGVPRLLFESHDLEAFDVSSDAQRFVGIRRTFHQEGPTFLAVVLNWFDDVKRRMAAEKKAP